MTSCNNLQLTALYVYGTFVTLRKQEIFLDQKIKCLFRWQYLELGTRYWQGLPDGQGGLLFLVFDIPPFCIIPTFVNEHKVHFPQILMFPEKSR